ncbi:MAG: hypothetical protein IPK64_02660 [bacterium]|nr:hypothetical protein [bacterium]
MRSWLVLLLVPAVMFPAPAQAYVDPGSGSLAVQGIIAAILGVGLTLRLYWRRIRDRLRGRPQRDDETDADA